MTSVFHVDIRESGEELKELMSHKRMLASESECVHFTCAKSVEFKPVEN